MKLVTNDIFMDMLNNPGQLSLTDYDALGVKPENVQFKDADVYRRLEKVKDAFTDRETGKFDEKAFKDFYDNIQVAYNAFATRNFANTLIELTKYDPHDKFAPKNADTYDTTPKLFKAFNPDRQSWGFIGINRQSDRTKSLDEIAQGQLVLKNPVEATNPDGTINEAIALWDAAPGDGLFTKLFWDNFFTTRVMAAWDEDGVHPDPITGEIVKHVKGEFKLNKNGTYYYENLDGRDVYGKQVLNRLNILTKEGTKANDYDFFDSDDLELKNVGAVALKNLALVGSMFIPWGVGLGLAAISAGTLITGMLATLGKMVQGSDSPNLSAIEGWALSWNRQYAKSAHAVENTWCLENFIDTFSDLVGQLREQRAIFELVPGVLKGTYILEELGLRAKYGTETLAPRLMKKYGNLDNVPMDRAKKVLEKSYQQMLTTGNTAAAESTFALVLSGFNIHNGLTAQQEIETYLKSYNKIGSALSKTYMAGLISLHMYGEAKSLGLSDIEATAVTLGRFLAETALLNTPLGEYMFPELRMDGMRFAKLQTGLYNKLKDSFSKIPENASKEVKTKWFMGAVKKAKDMGLDVQAERLTSGGNKLMSAFTMGVEAGLVNDIEEGLNDLAIGTYNTLNWLGTGSTMKHNDKYFDRYAMGFAAGLVGGGITSYVQSYQQFQSLNDITNDNVLQQFLYLHRNGQMEKFLKYIDTHDIASPNLSGVFEDNGFKAADGKTPDQNTVFRNIIHKLAELIKDILEENHANLTDLQFKEEILLNKDLRLNFLLDSPIAGRYLQEFLDAIAEVVRIKADIANITEGQKSEAVDSKKDDVPTNEGLLASKLLELKEALQNLLDILEGKKSGQFFAESIVDLTLGIKSLITPEIATKELYIASMTGRPVDLLDKLSSNERAKWEQAFESYIKSNVNADNFRFIAKNWLALNQKLSTFFEQHDKDYQALSKNTPYQQTIDTIEALLQQTNQLTALGNDATDVALASLAWGPNPLTGQVGLQLQIIANLDTQLIKGLNTLFSDYITAHSEHASALVKYKKVESSLKEVLAKIDKVKKQIAEPKEDTDVEALTEELRQYEKDEMSLLDEHANAETDVIKAHEKRLEAKSAHDKYALDLLISKTIGLLDPIIKLDYINPIVKINIKALVDKIQKMFWKVAGLNNVESVEQLYAYSAALAELGSPFADSNEYQEVKKESPQDFERLYEVSKKVVDDTLFNDGDLSKFSLEEYNKVAQVLGYKEVQEIGDMDMDLLASLDEYNAQLDAITVKYQTLTDEVNAFNESLSKKTHTPIFDFLKQYAVVATGNLNILNVLENVDAAWRKNINTLENLGDENDLLKAIPETKRLLALAKASVVAARSDTGSFMDIFNGVNAAINNYNSKTEEYVPLYEMNAETADMLNTDIDTVYQQLRVIENIIQANATRKLQGQNRVQTNLGNLIYKKTAAMLENATLYGMSKIKEAFNQMTVHAKNANNDDLSRTDEERFAQELELQDFGKALYEWANSDEGKSFLNDEDKVKDWLMNNFNVFDREVSILDEKAKVIDNIAYLNWLTTRMALDPETFNGIMKDLVSTDLVPIPTQNEVVYLMLANHVNKPLFSKMHNALREAIKTKWASQQNEADKKKLLDNLPGEFYKKETAPYILTVLPAPQWDNIVLSEGGAGVGKTTGVFTYLVKILKGIEGDKSMDNAWFVSVASENKQTGKLEGSKGAEAMAKAANVSKYKAMNHSELLEALVEFNNTNWKLDEKGQIVADNVVLKELTGENKPTAIFIDEVSHLSFLEMDAISLAAKALGIDIYAFGDLNQSGVKLEIDVKKLGNYSITAKLDLALESHQFISTMKLGVSMRTANEQQNENNAEFVEYFRNPSEHPTIKLRYYLEENSFKGVKVYDLAKVSGDVWGYSGISNALKDIRQMITLALKESREDFKKVGYIARTDADGNIVQSDLYKSIMNDDTLKEHITVYKGNAAQGRESSYFIVDINPESNLFDKDLYTGITRASEGVLLYTLRNRGEISDTKIRTILQNGPDASTKPDVYTLQSRELYAKGRKATLSKLAPGTDYIKKIKIVSDAENKSQERTFTGDTIPSEYFDGVRITITKDQIIYQLEQPIELSLKFIADHIKEEGKEEKPTSVIINSIVLGYSNGKALSLLQVHDTITDGYYLLIGITSIEQLTTNKVQTPDSEVLKDPVTTSETLTQEEFKQLESLAKSDEFEDDFASIDADFGKQSVMEMDDQNLLDHSFDAPVVPTEVKSTGNTLGVEVIDFDLVYHTFNTQTLGVKIVDDSIILPYIGHEKRIDSVNGLLNIINKGKSEKYIVRDATASNGSSGFLIADKNSGVPLNQTLIESILADIWRACIMSPNKEYMTSVIKTILGINATETFENQGIFITFGLQNIRNFKKGTNNDYNQNPLNPKKGNEVSDFAPFTRHKDERSIHNPSVAYSDYDQFLGELNEKVPVQVFGATIGVIDEMYTATSWGKATNLITIPLFTYSSPITIMLMKDPKSTDPKPKLLFGESFEEFKKGYAANKSVFDGLRRVKEYIAADDVRKIAYSKLDQLIDIWLGSAFTGVDNHQDSYNDFWTVSDNKWVPYGNLEYHGPKFTTHKGTTLFMQGLYKDYNLQRQDSELDMQPLNILYANKRLTSGNIYTFSRESISKGVLMGNYLGTHTSGRKHMVGVGQPFILVHSLTENYMRAVLSKINFDTSQWKGFPIEMAYFQALNDLQYADYFRTKPKIKIDWVRTPGETASNYVRNLHKILIGESNSGTPTYAKHLGDSLTIYRIWEAISNDEDFKKLMLESPNVFAPLFNRALEEVGKLKSKVDTYRERYNRAESSRKDVSNAYDAIQKALDEELDWAKDMFNAHSSTNVRSLRYHLIGALHRLMFPNYGTHVVEDMRNQWSDTVAKALDQAYGDGNLIYYRLPHALGTRNTGSLLLLNDDGTGHSKLTVTMMDGTEKPIVTPGKIDTETLSGKILFTYIGKNKEVDFFDDIHEKLLTRPDQGHSYAMGNYVYLKDSWIRPFPEKGGQKVDTMDPIRSQVIGAIESSGKLKPYADVLKAAIQKAGSKQAIAEAINSQLVPVAAVYTNGGNEIFLIDTEKIASANETKFYDPNIAWLTFNGEVGGRAKRIFSVGDCGDGSVRLGPVTSDETSVGFINNPFTSDSTFKEEMESMYKVFDNATKLAKSVLSRSGFLQALSNNKFNTAEEAYRALSTSLVKSTFGTDGRLTEKLIKLAEDSGNDKLAEMLKEKKLIDELKGCNTPITLKLL